MTEPVWCPIGWNLTDKFGLDPIYKFVNRFGPHRSEALTASDVDEHVAGVHRGNHEIHVRVAELPNIFGIEPIEFI